MEILDSKIEKNWAKLAWNKQKRLKNGCFFHKILRSWRSCSHAWGSFVLCVWSFTSSLSAHLFWDRIWAQIPMKRVKMLPLLFFSRVMAVVEWRQWSRTYLLAGWSFKLEPLFFTIPLCCCCYWWWVLKASPLWKMHFFPWATVATASFLAIKTIMLPVVAFQWETVINYTTQLPAAGEEEYTSSVQSESDVCIRWWLIHRFYNWLLREQSYQDSRAMHGKL